MVDLRIRFYLLFFLLFTGCFSTAQRTIIIDQESLEHSKLNIKSGNEPYLSAYNQLLDKADATLQKPLYSVVFNDKPFQKIDDHNYITVAPYWWPNPDTEDGLPYILKDGQANPEARKNSQDRSDFNKMANEFEIVSLAYHFSGKKKYAKRAVSLLRTWFLDEDTRMNPHLQFAQGIPGKNKGRAIGIIETNAIIKVVDGLGLIEGSRKVKPADINGMKKWLNDFLDWLLTSKNGKTEGKQKNNHGTWYQVQVASLAVYLERYDVAKKILSQSLKRIDSQINPSGKQPHEMYRTKSFSYSMLNLLGMMHLARLGEHVGIDMWNYEGKGSLKKGLLYLSPYANPENEWKGKQIISASNSRFCKILRLGIKHYDTPEFKEALSFLECNNAVVNLTY